MNDIIGHAMLTHLKQISISLDRIAKALEAPETRARECQAAYETRQMMLMESDPVIREYRMQENLLASGSTLARDRLAIILHDMSETQREWVQRPGPCGRTMKVPTIYDSDRGQ